MVKFLLIERDRLVWSQVVTTSSTDASMS